LEKWTLSSRCLRLSGKPRRVMRRRAARKRKYLRRSKKFEIFLITIIVHGVYRRKKNYTFFKTTPFSTKFTTFWGKKGVVLGKKGVVLKKVRKCENVKKMKVA